MAEKSQKKTWDEEMVELFHDYEKEISSSDNSPGTAHAAWEKSPRVFRFWDINQKFLRVMNNTLIASPKDQDSQEELIAVLPNTSLDVKAQAIFMGLKDGNKTMSCVKSGDGQPQLQLTERHIMDLYKTNEKFLSFSFYSRTDGGPDTCSFESAEFPGLFISTSSEPNKPLGLSQKGGPENILFYFKRESH